MVRSAVIAATLITTSALSSTASAQTWSDEPAFALSTPALAQTAMDEAENKLLIVDRDRGRVIYDNGRNDLYCAAGTYFIGYTYYGWPVYRRTMSCR